MNMVIFQHNGAPPHLLLEVYDYLD